jgi:hypothetical protein
MNINMNMNKNYNFSVYNNKNIKWVTLFNLRAFSNSNKLLSQKDNIEEKVVNIYLNADLFLSKILKENRKKTGIYRWTNNITGDSYVESVINLSKRFNDYLNIAFLNKELKKVEVLYIVLY